MPRSSHVPVVLTIWLRGVCFSPATVHTASVPWNCMMMIISPFLQGRNKRLNSPHFHLLGYSFYFWKLLVLSRFCLMCFPESVSWVLQVVKEPLLGSCICTFSSAISQISSCLTCWFSPQSFAPE